MAKLLLPPPEPVRVSALDGLAPKFRFAVEQILANMHDAGHSVRVFESLRSDERQQWLYGFGRQWTDGRANGSTVTNVRTAMTGWHFFGLAVDIVEDDTTPWVSSNQFHRDLGQFAETHNCRWGGRWKMADLPHVQWGPCRKSPSADAVRIYNKGGLAAVWAAVGAS